MPSRESKSVKGKTKISVHDAIACTSGFHEGVWDTRPTCVKIYFVGDETRWVQICEKCWDKLDKKVKKKFEENKKTWGSTLTTLVKKSEVWSELTEEDKNW
jgi:hypothetical protein